MDIQGVLEGKNGSVVTIRSDATAGDAVTLMTRLNIGALIVVDFDGRLAGIISERDIARAAGMDRSLVHVRVRELMTRDVECAAPSDEVGDVLQRMSDGRFRHLPVLSGGEIVGIVSSGDLVKAQLEAAQAAAQG